MGNVNPYFLGTQQTFKGDDSSGSLENTVYELTDIHEDGTIEMAFDGERGRRHYLQFKPSDLVLICAQWAGGK